jgi:hypothetical protein
VEVIFIHSYLDEFVEIPCFFAAYAFYLYLAHGVAAPALLRPVAEEENIPRAAAKLRISP